MPQKNNKEDRNKCLFNDSVNCQHSGVDGSIYIIHLSKNLASKRNYKLQICAKNKIHYFCSDS